MITTAFAQQEHDLNGLADDDEAYVSLGNVDTSYVTRGDLIPPKRFNYRDQTTIPVFDQGYLPACVGYAIAAVTTIRLSLFCSALCDCKKALSPFSAAYIYNQVAGGKPRAISLAIALDTLQQQGICPEAVFKNNRHSALKQPDDTAREMARRYSFWKAERIFYLPIEMTDDLSRAKVTLTMLKTHLAGYKPVIVGLRCPEDFKTFVGNVYVPGMLPDKANHAAVVIGYDDQARTVEILNSFGTAWGDGGLARIGYDDFFRMVRYGYVVRLDGGIGKACEMK